MFCKLQILIKLIKYKIIKEVIITGTITFEGTENLSELGLLNTDRAGAFNHIYSVISKNSCGPHICLQKP
jgi:hypothetical protein